MPMPSHACIAAELWRASTGSLHVVLDLATTTFSGDDETIDALSTSAIVLLVAEAAVEAARGRTHNVTAKRVQLWVPQTVRREGAGVRTALVGDGPYVQVRDRHAQSTNRAS